MGKEDISKNSDNIAGVSWLLFRTGFVGDEGCLLMFSQLVKCYFFFVLHYYDFMYKI